ERQADGDREREAGRHAVERVQRVERHGAVERGGDERAGDVRQGRQQGGWEVTAARGCLVGRRRDQQRCRGAGERAGAGACVAHVIMPQRTTVNSSRRRNTNFSSTRPSTAITTMPASITSVARNSRAPKMSQPRPHGTAASISTP